MAQRVTAHLDDDVVERLQEMKEAGYADSISEALRIELGHERQHATSLEEWAARLGDAFAIATVAMIGATFLYPLAFRIFVVVPLLAALTCYGFRRVLDRYEPAVSARLPFGGEKA